jgi:outer membrane translocation and assembly module TamA
MHRLFSVLLVLALTAVAPCADDADIGDARAVSVRALTLTHTNNLSVEAQNFVIEEVRSHSYKSTALDEIAERIRFALQERGYFKVLVDDPIFRQVSRDQHHEIVDVTVAVEEGQIYRLANIRFSNTAVFTPVELRGQFRIGDGDILNRQKIADGLERLRLLYGRKGYVNCSAVPDTDIDETAHTVSLLIDLDVGKAFHLGKLTVRGEESEPGARNKLLTRWKNYEGKIYDPHLLTEFLQDVGARRSVRPEEVFEISQDTQTGSINVQITLVKPYTLLVWTK